MCSDGQDGLNVCDGCDDEGVDMQGIVKDFGRVEVVMIMGVQVACGVLSEFSENSF